MIFNPKEKEAPLKENKIKMSAFCDSQKKPYLVSVDPTNIENHLLQLRVDGHKNISFAMPQQEQNSQQITIHPRVAISPPINNANELELVASKSGILVFKPIEVNNLFGIFKSKEKILTLLVHGGRSETKHLLADGRDSRDYFIGLRDKLLELNIRPPQMFISCDEQITSDNAEQKIIFHRFDQKGEFEVLGFPALLNRVSLGRNGELRVLEGKEKEEVGLEHVNRTSVSTFANPTNADLRLVLLVQKLFDCPESFNYLVQERLKNKT